MRYCCAIKHEYLESLLLLRIVRNADRNTGFSIKKQKSILFIYLFACFPSCGLLPSGFSAHARCCFQFLLPLSPLTASSLLQVQLVSRLVHPGRPAVLIRSTLTLGSFVLLLEIDGRGTPAQSFHVLIKALRSAIGEKTHTQAARVLSLWSESIFTESKRGMGDKVQRPDVQS